MSFRHFDTRVRALVVRNEDGRVVYPLHRGSRYSGGDDSGKGTDDALGRWFARGTIDDDVHICAVGRCACVVQLFLRVLALF